MPSTDAPSTNMGSTDQTSTDQTRVVAAWIAATNTHDVDRYLSFFADDAVLDDPSVGEAFTGRGGLARYFQSYFVGYNTHTRLVGTEPRGGALHVEVDFTGDFPGGQTGGTFEVTFAGQKLARVTADLL